MVWFGGHRGHMMIFISFIKMKVTGSSSECLQMYPARHCRAFRAEKGSLSSLSNATCGTLLLEHAEHDNTCYMRLSWRVTARQTPKCKTKLIFVITSFMYSPLSICMNGLIINPSMYIDNGLYMKDVIIKRSFVLHFMSLGLSGPLRLHRGERERER